MGQFTDEIGHVMKDIEAQEILLQERRQKAIRLVDEYVNGKFTPAEDLHRREEIKEQHALIKKTAKGIEILKNRLDKLQGSGELPKFGA